MASNTKNIIRDIAGAPIPQYYNPAADAFEALKGSGGASRVILYDESGNPVDIVGLIMSVINELQNPKPIQVQTNIMEYFGRSTDTRPPVSETPVGAVFYEVDTEIAYINDGTAWVEV